MDVPTPAREIRMESESGAPFLWGIAEETAVEIGFNGKAWTVMMATPYDIEDLAVGLAFTSGALPDASRVKEIRITAFPDGITADIRLDPEHLETAALARRTLDGVTGCGLCGVETLADAARPRTLRRTVPLPTIEPRAVTAAFAALPSHQPLNDRTHTVHAAAWADPGGDIMLVREDVGRHNALDKLIGARLRERYAGEPGFIVMSSRCSFELVAKTARTNAALLATVSAPTGAALDLAEAVGLPLACRGAGGSVIVFPPENQRGIEHAG